MNPKRFLKQLYPASLLHESKCKHFAVRWPRVIALTLPVFIIGHPSASFAQESAPVLEEIFVTGSHIRKDTFSSSSPISLLDSSAIDGTGAVNMSDILGKVPSITGSVTGTSANVNEPQNSGISTVALRNLGSSITLVLVNGRRYVSGVSAGAGYGVDLNSIPASIIEHVEVLTGGQSAAYGSDAVAGVINVITKTNFDGVELKVQGGAVRRG